MDGTPEMGIREFRRDLAERVEAAYFNGAPTTITKNGQPRAALIPYAWLDWCKQHFEQEGPAA